MNNQQGCNENVFCEEEVWLSSNSILWYDTPTKVKFIYNNITAHDEEFDWLQMFKS